MRKLLRQEQRWARARNCTVEELERLASVLRQNGAGAADPEHDDRGGPPQQLDPPRRTAVLRRMDIPHFPPTASGVDVANGPTTAR